MSAPKITIWKRPGVWPKLTRDPYAPSSVVDAPTREMDEDGSHRLLYHGDVVIALSPDGISLDRQGTAFICFAFGDWQMKSFVIHGGRDEIKWLRDSIGPGRGRI